MAKSKLKTVFRFLTKECPFETTHWKWERLCQCGWSATEEDLEGLGIGVGEPGDELESWHGGILDMETGIELLPCAACDSDVAQETNQHYLTGEEALVLTAWRAYRENLLDAYGNLPYSYELYVKHQGMKIPLLDYDKGVSVLRYAKLLPSEAEYELEEKPKLSN